MAARASPLPVRWPMGHSRSEGAVSGGEDRKDGSLDRMRDPTAVSRGPEVRARNSDIGLARCTMHVAQPQRDDRRSRRGGRRAQQH